MPFSRQLESLILNALSKFIMYRDSIERTEYWSNEHVDFLNYCLTKGHLSPEKFRSAVRLRIEAFGKEMALSAFGPKGEFADHVSSPHALAYALQYSRVINPTHKRYIRFDHGDTAETFMVGEIDDLVEHIMLQLQTPLEPPIYTDTQSSNCAEGPCTCSS